MKFLDESALAASRVNSSKPEVMTAIYPATPPASQSSLLHQICPTITSLPHQAWQLVQPRPTRLCLSRHTSTWDWVGLASGSNECPANALTVYLCYWLFFG
ncbi:uncharacterized protein LOC123506603 isoform X3 [Portunus trituberculatus]|uniref:uncharacterized protein LOC123506603 isoform X3 n=1 Tax=Portunus trituberculatus TaxID=210409 RepID=UPI001E1D02FC|nr:uncharacterized protein LOC123506603 isoform X3 [Portunus trituberculatus]